jgi:hypothetical protein
MPEEHNRNIDRHADPISRMVTFLNVLLTMTLHSKYKIFHKFLYY